MSPRIAWFNFLGALKLLTKIALLLAILLSIAYGVRQAIEHTFHKNPDFRLQVIDVSPNDALDENALVGHLNIDLAANIFDFDVDLMRQELLEIPAISSAKVERELPGTLVFRIVTRKPVAWISNPEEGLGKTREVGALLVDLEGFVYPCPAGQLPEAYDLPAMILTPDPDHPVVAGQTLKHPQYRHCTRLLNAFRSTFPNDISMIDAISQEKQWSLDLTTRAGTTATFGLGNHERQLDYFSKALHHAQKKGYQIETINLIPKRNVPITVRGDGDPPRAIPVSEEDLPADAESRRKNDLRSLLNRN